MTDKPEPMPAGDDADAFDAAWYGARYADITAAGLEPRAHYERYGRAEGRFPNAAAADRHARAAEVDPDWYAARYPDVAATGLEPAEHYRRIGHAEGRLPSAAGEARRARAAEVDPDWYRAEYVDIAAGGIDPEAHYADYGHSEGRFPNAAVSRRHALMRAVDPAWYAARYPDVAEAGLDPAEHYADLGFAAGFLPNADALWRRELAAQVDPGWYLENYPEVAAADMDPGEHYALYGHDEGRAPNAAVSRRHALMRAVDPAWYAARYPDVAEAGLDPAEHYADLGFSEGRLASADAERRRDLAAQVDPAWYLENYREVAAAGMDPGEHYALYGHDEGRFPNAEVARLGALMREVDPAWYAARYPDVVAAGMDPADHYARYGHAEGRLPNARRLPADVPSLSLPPIPPRLLRRYPVVGIVTPVRNRRTWTLGFARLLDGQDYPTFRLYVVDSHSTDGTPEALRALNLASVHVLEAPDSAYWTAATNIGVERALADGCEYVLTLNDDAIVPSDFLASIVQAVDEAGARIAGSVIAFADVPGRLWGVGAYNDWAEGSFLQTGMAGAWDSTLAAVPHAAPGLIEAKYLCGNGTLVHRSVFEEIGLYDARQLPHYHADSEFTMRAERAGIARYVAVEARLYNRFTEAGDGVFAARNQRLFSLRSANYAKPLLTVLDRYCPQELKARALVRYWLRHVREPGWRAWSRLLRVVRFLDTAPERRRVAWADFFPALDPTLSAAEDLDVLLDLSDTAFVDMLYPVLLRRDATDAERLAQARSLRDGRARRDIVGQVLARPEARHAAGTSAPFLAALLHLHDAPGAAPDDAEFAPQERWILRHVAAEGRLPGRAEARARLKAGADAPSGAETAEGAQRLAVYMNVDVLCMAVTDPKAATGVHRYVLNILRALMRDERVDLRLFHAEALATSAATLRAGSLAEAAFAAAGERPASGVVFYPYFPFAGKDRRFAALPQVMTICDLFPLTRPEWFSNLAVANFRRQLRDLIDADHVLCISEETRANLRATIPALRADASVAHLGVNPVEPDPAADMIEDGRYFVCVGTIEPRKNLRAVIAAMAHLTGPGVRDLRMLVVGQEGWSVTSGDLTAEAGEAAHRIRFLGRVPDERLWQLYRGAVCTVFPSLAEGFGFPIVESFACGTPVVTADGSSMAEIATAGALLVDPHDPAAIAGAIARIAEDGSLRSSLAEEAADLGGRFTWAACAERHVAVFRDLAERVGERAARRSA